MQECRMLQDRNKSQNQLIGKLRYKLPLIHHLFCIKNSLERIRSILDKFSQVESIQKMRKHIYSQGYTYMSDWEEENTRIAYLLIKAKSGCWANQLLGMASRWAITLIILNTAPQDGGKISTKPLSHNLKRRTGPSPFVRQFAT